MLELKKVSKNYGSNNVLSGVDFKINKGEFVTLTGPSGSGKSTLINLITGAEKVSGGEIIANEKSVSELKDNDLQMYRRTIGIVFQDYKLLPKKTVEENIAFALEVCDANSAEIEQKVRRAISTVGLEGKEKNFPHELSGGEQQRTAIARAIVHEPEIILADEPTGNLDIENSRSIINLFKELNEKGGKTILLTTHNPILLDWLSVRIAEIRGGKVWETVSQGVEITQTIIEEDIILD